LITISSLDNVFTIRFDVHLDPRLPIFSGIPGLELENLVFDEQLTETDIGLYNVPRDSCILLIWNKGMKKNIKELRPFSQTAIYIVTL
jgi:hypothetical protein